MPLLKDTIEKAVHDFIRDRCRATKGVRFEGVGGTPTHLHLVVKVEPFICPSTFVGDLKGASAREINKRLRRQALKWQRGFGVVSFAKKHLSGVLAYIAQQKQLHAARTLKDALECHSWPQPSAA
jgi:REP element-mobilizing transposase RayT